METWLCVCVLVCVWMDGLMEEWEDVCVGMCACDVERNTEI